jgi:hypothetical protein
MKTHEAEENTATVGADDSAETFDHEEIVESAEGSGPDENDENSVSDPEDTEVPESAMAVEKTKKSSVASVEIKKINDAVKFINEKANKMVYKGSVEIGNYILEHFFGNDTSLASSKNPKKPVSYGKLCRRKDLLLSSMELSTMVRVASQEKFLKEKKVDVSKLTYTHKARLTKLENGDLKIGLVKDCIEKGWSTRVLTNKINESMGELIPGNESPLIANTESYLAAIKRFQKLKNPIPANDSLEVSSLKSEERVALQQKLDELKAGIEKFKEESTAIENFCNELIKKLSEDEAGRDEDDNESLGLPMNSDG